MSYGRTSTMWTWMLAAALLLTVTLAAPELGAAATLTVTNFGDSGAPGQLRTLLDAAAPGDTIVIPAGTITLTGPADASGGGLPITKTVTIQGAGPGLTIIDGGGLERGMLIYATAGPSVAISNLTIRNGVDRTVFGGAGMFIDAGLTVTLTNVAISGNRALGPGDGGGVLVYSGSTVTMSNVVVSGNASAAFSGGIVNFGTLTLTNVTVSGNSATNGAGITNSSEGVLTLANVTVSENTASEFGGGLDNFGAAALTNVTVSGNAATIDGGGIENAGGSTLTLVNVTVSGNTGGGIVNLGTVILKNVLLSGNTAPPEDSNCEFDPATPVTSLGHNLDSGTTCGFTGPGDLNNVNALLGPLQNNGGLTRTHALLSGSPAINAGTNTGCPATDQRGVGRPQGATCDIGAFEFAATVAAVALNGSTFHTGQQITYQGTFSPGFGPTQVDIYAGAVLPDGTTFASLVNSPSGIGIVIGPTPVPFSTNVTLAPLAVPFAYIFTGTEPVGTYLAYAWLAVPGTDPLHAANQLSLATQTFQFVP